MKGLSAHRVLLYVGMVVLSACDWPANSAEERTPRELRSWEPVEIPAGTTRVPDYDPLSPEARVVTLNGMRLAVPMNYGVGSPWPTYQGAEVATVTMYGFWDGTLRGRTTHQDLDTASIRMSLSTGLEMPYPLPSPEEHLKTILQQRRVQPAEFNAALGLMEHKTGNPQRLIYTFADPDLRDPDGQIPYLICTFNTNQCLYFGRVGPQLRLAYTIRPKHLPDWPAIHTAVHQFVESLIID